MDLDAVIVVLLSLVTVLTAFLAMGWFLFGYVDTLGNWFHRRDLNKNVRRDTNINYALLIERIKEDVSENGNITNREDLINLIANINSSAGKSKWKTGEKLIFNKKILINQLKNCMETPISNNFKINEKYTINDFTEELKIDNSINRTPQDALLLLIAMSTSVFTDLSLISKQDDKFEEIVLKSKELTKKMIITKKLSVNIKIKK